MAQLPKVDTPSVMPSGRPLQYTSIDVGPDAFGAAIGRSLANFGSTIAEVGATLDAHGEKLRQEAAKTSANQAFVTASMAANDLEANYLQTMGTNAAAGYGDFSEGLKKIRQEALDSLEDDDAKKLFDNAFQSNMLSGANSGAVHAAQQGRQAAVDASKARVDIIMNDSSTKFMDEDLFQSNLAALDQQLAEQGKLLGWGPETLLSEQRQQHSLAWESRITSMAMTDPLGANQLFARVRDDLTVENRLRVQSTIAQASRVQAAEMGRADARTGMNGDVRPAFQEGIIQGGRNHGADEFLISRTDKGRDAILGMQPETSARLAALIESAPPGIKENITIFSGHRSLEHQAQLYAKSGGSGMVAKPTPNAPHVRGDAADLGWKGGSFKSMPPEAVKWLHDNAPQFGMVFRLANEPWHIERASGPRRTPVAMQPGSFVNRIINAEGGGAGVFSPVGAAGLMQVMPDTGRDVALSLGIPWDPHRLAHDDQYNLLIGTAYLNQLLNRYGGDEMLTAAAYNAGPGRVDEWIARFGDPRIGQISYADWAARIPYAETRGYVAKVLGAAGPQPAAVPVSADMTKDQFDAFVQTKREWAQANFPGDLQFEEAYVGGITQEYNDMVAERKAQEAENYDLLLGMILPQGEEGEYVTQAQFMAALQSNPELAARWEGLESTKKNTILNQLRKNDKLNTKEETDAVNPKNLAEYDRLSGMWRLQNDAFLKEDIANNPILNNLQKTALINLKRQKPDAEKTATPADIDLASALRVGASAIAAAGLQSGANASDTQLKQYNTFVGSLVRILDEETQRKGSKLTEVEMHTIVQNLLMKNVISAPSTFLGQPIWILPDWAGGGSAFNSSKEINTFEDLSFYPREDSFVGADLPPNPTAPFRVPPEIRQRIIDTYTAKTGKPPTEAAVNQIYFQYRKGQAAR